MTAAGTPFSSRTFPSPLYAIIDTGTLGGRSPVDVARAVLAGGGRLIQLRMKDRPSRELFAAASALRTLTAHAGACLIINDRLDIALAAGADGVHLGADDLPIEAARRIAASRLLLGRSTHGIAEAAEAAAGGADYIAFGPIFPTTTKILSYKPQGLEQLRSLRARVTVPIVAIGGITEATAASVRAAGADAVAMIGELARAASIEEKVARLLVALC